MFALLIVPSLIRHSFLSHYDCLGPKLECQPSWWMCVDDIPIRNGMHVQQDYEFWLKRDGSDVMMSVFGLIQQDFLKNLNILDAVSAFVHRMTKEKGAVMATVKKASSDIHDDTNKSATYEPNVMKTDWFDTCIFVCSLHSHTICIPWFMAQHSTSKPNETN